MLQLARRLTARRLKAFSIRTLSAASSQDSPKRVPLAAGGIGVAGLIPFVGSTVGIVMYPSATAELLHLQSAYGATILSFMGAVHWVLLTFALLYRL